jgi:hypothetical protein
MKQKHLVIRSQLVSKLTYICLFASLLAAAIVGKSQVITRRIPVWSSTFESGNASDWYLPVLTANGYEGGGAFASGLATSVVSRNHAHSGNWSLKMMITTPPESGIRMFRWLEPNTYKDLYYSAWFYFPQRYSARNYWNIFQWKSRISPTVAPDPFFVLNVGNREDGEMYLYLYNWQTRQSYIQTLKNIPLERWFNITANYTCAGTHTGHVTIWQDDTELFDVQNVQTRYGSGDCSWSVDNYSDSVVPSPATIYTDDVEIFIKPPVSIFGK